MINGEVITKCNLADILSHSKQIGLLTALQLRKNNVKIGAEISGDIESIKKMGQTKEEVADSPEVKQALEDFLAKEFEGNFYMVNINEIGNIKGEDILLANGNTVDAKWVAEQLVGSIIITPSE